MFCNISFSNIGGTTINDVALDFWHSGQNREDIGMEDLEHRLRAEAMESQGTNKWLYNHSHKFSAYTVCFHRQD